MCADIEHVCDTCARGLIQHASLPPFPRRVCRLFGYSEHGHKTAHEGPFTFLFAYRTFCFVPLLHVLSAFYASWRFSVLQPSRQKFAATTERPVVPCILEEIKIVSFVGLGCLTLSCPVPSLASAWFLFVPSDAPTDLRFVPWVFQSVEFTPTSFLCQLNLKTRLHLSVLFVLHQLGPFPAASEYSPDSFVFCWRRDMSVGHRETTNNTRFMFFRDVQPDERTIS